jgi:hypothetical protein
MCDAIVPRIVVDKDLGAGVDKIKMMKCHPRRGRLCAMPLYHMVTARRGSLLSHQMRTFLTETGLSLAPNIISELKRSTEVAMKISIDISSGSITVCLGEARQIVSESVCSCGYPTLWGLLCSHLLCAHRHLSESFPVFLVHE